MMNNRVLFSMAVLVAVLLSGCRRDEKGQASLTVQTTLPRGIVVSLASVERPGTYVERATTDLSGTLQYIGIKPGEYKLILQISVPDTIPSNPSYNYDESDPFTIKAGHNRVEWTVGTNEVVSLE